jgi:hypothetical protein
MKNNYSKQSENFTETWTDQASPSPPCPIGSIYQDENLTLSLTFFINQTPLLTHLTSINRNRKVTDLWTTSMSLLSQIHYTSHSIQDLKIYHGPTQLLMFHSLHHYALPLSCPISIYIKTQPNNPDPNSPDSPFIQKNLLPKIDYNAYKTKPSQVDLARMSENEISKVKGFEIYNKYGKVRFMVPVDLIGVDFVDGLVIGHREI